MNAPWHITPNFHGPGSTLPRWLRAAPVQKPDGTLEERTKGTQRLEDLVNPVVRGWMNYCGRFRRRSASKSCAISTWPLQHWVRWKYKPRNRERASMHWLTNRVFRGQEFA